MPERRYYYRLVGLLPPAVRRRFYSFTAYVDSWTEVVLDEPQFRRAKLTIEMRDELRALVFLRSLLFRLESAQRYADRAVRLAVESGMGGWSVGTVNFDEDSGQLEVERRAVESFHKLFAELGIAEATRGTMADVVRRFLSERLNET